MTQRITLKEVAIRAGVSYQTVSKVLNRQAQVSKETEARIWEAVQQLGYRPNQLARSLRSLQSKLIGYSWDPTPPDQENPILDQFLQSIVGAAESAGYHLLAFPFRTGEEWLDVYRELIDTHRVDGFVLSSVEFNDPRIQFLQERDFPFVTFGRSNPDWSFPYVDVDGGDGMRQVIEHLVEQGHRRIAVLAWPESSRVGGNRMDGLLAALASAGLQLPRELVLRGEGGYSFGMRAVGDWLRLSVERRPTAIVAFSDVIAIGAMQAVQAYGLRIGSDMAITGFDDMNLVRFLNPPLTSVRQPIWEVGQKITSMLLDRVVGKEPSESQVLLAPELIVRASSLCNDALCRTREVPDPGLRDIPTRDS